MLDPAKNSSNKQAAASTAQPSISELKSKLKATWSDGDYDVFSRPMAAGAVAVIEQWGITSGEKVLDVACGSGQTAIPSAKLGAIVTGIDIADNTIDAAKNRATDEGVKVDFSVADAEEMPFNDGSYDVIISMFGAMFAPRPERVIEEFARVCRKGGRIHMANWTPQGMVGKMFKIIGGHVPPPNMPSPLLWGDEETMMERLEADFSNINLNRVFYPSFTYPFGANELVDFFDENYGPVKRAFGVLDEKSQAELRSELIENFKAHNAATDGTLDLRAEFLNIAAIRK